MGGNLASSTIFATLQPHYIRAGQKHVHVRIAGLDYKLPQISQNQYGLISHAISSWWTASRYVKILFLCIFKGQFFLKRMSRKICFEIYWPVKGILAMKGLFCHLKTNMICKGQMNSYQSFYWAFGQLLSGKICFEIYWPVKVILAMKCLFCFLKKQHWLISHAISSWWTVPRYVSM